LLLLLLLLLLMLLVIHRIEASLCIIIIDHNCHQALLLNLMLLWLRAHCAGGHSAVAAAQSARPLLLLPSVLALWPSCRQASQFSLFRKQFALDLAARLSVCVCVTALAHCLSLSLSLSVYVCLGVFLLPSHYESPFFSFLLLLSITIANSTCPLGTVADVLETDIYNLTPARKHQFRRHSLALACGPSSMAHYL